MPARLDSIDRKILKELQADGRITNVELASRVGISAPPCLRRVRALEEAAVAATKAVEAGASACELLDKTFLAYAASGEAADPKFRERTEGAAAILLSEVESYSTDSAAKAGLASTVCDTAAGNAARTG